MQINNIELTQYCLSTWNRETKDGPQGPGRKVEAENKEMLIKQVDRRSGMCDCSQQ